MDDNTNKEKQEPIIKRDFLLGHSCMKVSKEIKGQLKVLLIIIISIAVAFSNLQLVQTAYGRAAGKVTIIIKAGSTYMNVDGVKKKIDAGSSVSPRLSGSEMLSPFKAIIETMGGSMKYISGEKRVDLVLGNRALQLWIGKTMAKLDGKTKKLTVVPQIVSGAIMIPVKFAVESLGGAAVLNSRTKEMTISYVKQVKESKAAEDILVINTDEFTSKEYVIKQDKSGSYIFLPDKRFRYSLKCPYLQGSAFPYYSESDGDMTFSWKNGNEVVLEIKISVGSTKADVNGEVFDIGMAPYRQDDKIMIPINFFVSALDMEYDTDKDTGVNIFHYKEDFPKALLYGTWSSTDVNLFMGFKDLTSGLVTLPSFADSFTFNKDGTYHYAIISCGGFNDAFITQNGKYKIYGNTIMFYDIVETMYEGRPFALRYKDKHLEDPQFLFIDNYNEEENKLEIDSLWVNKQN